MAGIISEEYLKKRLASKFKTKLAWSDFREIMEGFLIQIREIYEEFLLKEENIELFLNNFEHLCNNTNEKFTLIGKQYGNIPPKIICNIECDIFNVQIGSDFL